MFSGLCFVFRNAKGKTFQKEKLLIKTFLELISKLEQSYKEKGILQGGKC